MSVWLCACVCVCAVFLRLYVLYPTPVCHAMCVRACKCYHLAPQKQYELRCILNAPIESYVTVEREPNTSLNNAY